MLSGLLKALYSTCWGARSARSVRSTLLLYLERSLLSSRARHFLKILNLDNACKLDKALTENNSVMQVLHSCVRVSVNFAGVVENRNF